MSGPLLEIEELSVSFPSDAGALPAVRSVGFAIAPGQTVALVGESGSGKSVTALAAMGLLPPSTRVSGSVRFEGRELLRLAPSELRKVRGGSIAMVFQEPMTSLNPVLRIGRQIEEVLALHRGFDAVRARAEAIELLGHVGIASPERRVDQYPHELSGGMKQRVMLAMAVAGRPKLLIADEPTTALDVTIQAQILKLLRTLCREQNMALLLITHDFGIVAHFAEQVNVMYGGKIVERAPVVPLFASPSHPYTRALLAAMPRAELGRARLEAIPGRVPALDQMPAGCPFAPRCKLAFDRCVEMPPLSRVLGDSTGQHVACWAVETETT